MKVGSLFSGVGGLDLGLERAGMTVEWQVENDPFCCQVLAKHWPGVARHGDIRTLDPGGLAPVDLVCGGFPCQPVAQNGHRLGSDDSRWLWPEYVRILRVVRPRFVFVENVRDLVVRGMGQVFGDLAALGFDAEWESLPASALGAPHERRRVFVVAYPNGFGWETPRVFDRNPREDVLQTQPWGSISRRGAHGRVRAFPEADVFGVVDGSADYVDRLRGLGNAVVPQVAEWIGRRVMEAEWS